MCGATERELAGVFGPELDAMAPELGRDRDGCLAALRAQYDGYCFHAAGPGGEAERVERTVYNPFSLLNALEERRLGSW